MAHRRGRGSKTIDTVHWTFGSFAFAAVATSATSAVNVLAAQHLPETLLRIRGEWCAWLDALSAPELQNNVTIGLIQVPEGTGTTVLWSPVTDGDAPWIWWDVMMLAYEEKVTDVVDVPGMTSGRRIIDSKAMRKLRNTEIQCVVESTLPFGSGGNANIVGSARFLAGS